MSEIACNAKVRKLLDTASKSSETNFFRSFPILNRCVPDKDSAAAGIIYDFYAYLNSFDFFSQVMADLYASHREIIGLSVAGLSKNFPRTSHEFTDNQCVFSVLSGIFLAVLYFHTQAIVYVILTLVTLATTGMRSFSFKTTIYFMEMLFFSWHGVVMVGMVQFESFFGSTKPIGTAQCVAGRNQQ